MNQTARNLPKYQRLVSDLEEAIGDGRFAPGAKLPSVRELMHLQQLSLTTVTTALAVLEERGLIEPRPRSGYFVRVVERAPRPVRRDRELDSRTGFHWWPSEDLFPRERLRKLTASVVRRHPDLAIQSPRNNNPRLVRALAKRCAEIGCFVYEEDILVTHGVTEALSVALQVAASPGDALLVQYPVSPLHGAIAHRLGLRLELLDTRQPERAVLADLERMLAAPSGPRTLLLAANFHTPTGNLLSLEAKQEILRVAGAHGAVLIEDDSSGDLHFDPARPLPIKAFDRTGDVLYVSGATKCFAPGLQVGWIVSGQRRREPVEQVKSVSASAVDHLPQLVLAAFLAQGGHLPHLRKLRGELARRAAEFEGLLQPEIGPVRGLGARPGGYNRFLWAPGVTFDGTLEAECVARWPALFTGEAPVLRFKAGGLAANLSFALGEERRGELRACARRLAAFGSEAAE